METVTVGDRYALDGRLGEGGMGQVFRARHLQLGKAFALKVISPAFADDSVARARFNEEARLASEISHPHIVSVVDFGEDPVLGAYMVMELVEGDCLVSPGVVPMPVRRVCELLGQIADALAHIHRHGIVHGDVKADNILISTEADGARRRKVARLLDFGLARRTGQVQDEPVSGSPHYIAPERAHGRPATVATDVYALGVVGYLMVTGTLPFDGNIVEIMMAHLHQVPEQPSRRLGQPVDPALEQLILRAMEKDPAARHADVAAFRYELNTVMDMLDLRKRKVSQPIRAVDERDSTIVGAFYRSALPQALVTTGGAIVVANKQFRKLCGITEDVEGFDVSQSSLAALIPGFMAEVRAAHVAGRARERRTRVVRSKDQPRLDLVVWMSPLPSSTGADVHVIVRVEEVEVKK